jgi:hypothetical protein
MYKWILFVYGRKLFDIGKWQMANGKAYDFVSTK